MHSIFRHFLLLLVFVATTVFAQNGDDTSEINRLIKVGQIEQAAAKIESALASRPREPQLRFLRGVIQIEQKKNNDAIMTFQRMTEDFPELPEPYNNLAVLYAGQGQYDKARAALELAIRTHPSYATAHENLGDVYTKMASESYTKALQLDSGNNAAQVKLSVIKDLGSARPSKSSKPGQMSSVPPIPPVTTAVVPATAAAALPAVIAVKPPIATAAPSAAAPASADNSAANSKPSPVASPAPKTTKPEAKADESDVVYEVVRNWAKAWSNKNVDAYLASYGKGFIAPNGEDRKSWEKERRARIEGKRSIAVSLDSPTVEMNGNNLATVKFRQAYKADSLSTSSRKTLKLSKTQGSWKIIEEATGK